MRIAEAAEISRLSTDTIRFYEKSGLLAPIPRDAAGHRAFSPGDMSWLDIISKLRTTGMPMKQMQLFAKLNAEGEHTIPQRYELLRAHQERVRERRAEIEACEKILEHKLAVYGRRKLEMENDT